MLEKNPSKRIKLADVKKHAFFSNFDWNKLLQKQMVELAKDKHPLDFIEISDIYEEGFTFCDKDYTAENETVNRVKNWSFSIDYE